MKFNGYKINKYDLPYDPENRKINLFSKNIINYFKFLMLQ